MGVDFGSPASSAPRATDATSATRRIQMGSGFSVMVSSHRAPPDPPDGRKPFGPLNTPDFLMLRTRMGSNAHATECRGTPCLLVRHADAGKSGVAGGTARGGGFTRAGTLAQQLLEAAHFGRERGEVGVEPDRVLLAFRLR